MEVKSAVFQLKKNKACGFDSILAEVFKKNSLINHLHSFLNVCFNTGLTPKAWDMGIINPILKSSNTDPRDPMSYRGITLTPVLYKVYCHVLNTRLTSWAEETTIITDHQYGFRKGRSTTDSIATNIIETREKTAIIYTLCFY